MNTFVWTMVAVAIGIFAYVKLTAAKVGPKGLVAEGEGFTVDSITGVDKAPSEQPGTVGNTSGPIDRFAVPNPVGGAPYEGWTVKY